MPEASRAAPLAGVFPPRLVARLHREQFEGTLRVQAQGVTRVLYFRRGDIASAASNADEDRLHNILIREGRLTGPQVDMARARQRPSVSLGKTLIELGFLTPSELLQGARRQVRQILAAVFALSDGSFEVVPGPLQPEVTVLGLPARRIIFDAVLETGDRQTVVREMGSMESVYRATPACRDSLPALRLEAAHADVAANVDGTATLRDLSGRTRLDDLTVSKIVLALEILGLVEPVASEPRLAAPVSRRIVVESADEPAIPKEPVPIRLAFEPAPSPPEPATEPEPAPTPAPPMPRLTTPEEETREASQAPAIVFSEPEPVAAAAPPAEDIDEEPPPPADLPAFAAPFAAPTGWQIDPVTGERTHEGPVEMTFDGPVIPPPPRRQSGGRMLAAAGVLLVIALGAYAAVRLNRKEPAGSPEIAETRTARIATPPAAAETRPQAGTPAPVEPPAATEPAPAQTRPHASTPSPVEPAPAPAEPPAASSQPPVHIDGFELGPDLTYLTSGERLLDAGAVDRAADAFARTLSAMPAETFTLQMMIACEAETVHKARLGTRPGSGLFVTPVTVKDRSCYRVLWGLYATRAEAETAAQSPPPYFAAAGLHPAVVPLGRIRRPA